MNYCNKTKHNLTGSQVQEYTCKEPRLFLVVANISPKFMKIWNTENNTLLC